LKISDVQQGPGQPFNHNLVTYSSYLHIDGLLKLQKPLSTPQAHDEMLFIIIHQVYELWFKQINYELRTVVQCLDQKKLGPCFALLGRVSEIMRVLVEQISVLETMTPMNFNAFRSVLRPASGFQSFQFREFEYLLGVDAKEFIPLIKTSPEWKDKIEALIEERSLRVAVLDLFADYDIPQKDFCNAVVKIYEDPALMELQNLCEHLIRLDEQTLLWRFRHVQMVERMIGFKPGTGGSLGAEYLEKTLKKKAFPEIWEARTHMGEPNY